MNIDHFIHLLKRNLDNVLNKNIIVSNKSEKDYLGYSEWTYLFSVVLYKTCLSYNRVHKPHLLIAPEKGKKYPTDFSIESSQGDKLILIEHENDPKRIIHNFGKLLSRSKQAMEYLLVSYIKEKDEYGTVIKKIRNHKKKEGSRRKIHILLGREEKFECSSDYEYALI